MCIKDEFRLLFLHTAFEPHNFIYQVFNNIQVHETNTVQFSCNLQLPLDILYLTSDFCLLEFYIFKQEAVKAKGLEC